MRQPGREVRARIETMDSREAQRILEDAITRRHKRFEKWGLTESQMTLSDAEARALDRLLTDLANADYLERLP